MTKDKQDSSQIDFEDNNLLPSLFGDQDRNLKYLAKALKINISSRGNTVLLEGESQALGHAERILNALYAHGKGGGNITPSHVESTLHMMAEGASHMDDWEQDKKKAAIKTTRRLIVPRTPMQATYMQALQKEELVFGLGPAGTGKTYLAVAAAVSLMARGAVDRIILTRPAVEAGESLGFLPGDLREKVDPYLRPLYDALHDMMPTEQVLRKFESGHIEVAPLAYMRGRTLSNAFIILDEAQNTTPIQMKMFLTRMGENSKMVVNGDMTQIDLPKGVRSGLLDAVEILDNVDGVSFVEFNEKDVVRHPLVSKIVRAYKDHARRVS